METLTERKERIRKSGIKEKEFCVMVLKIENRRARIAKVRATGIAFEKEGISLYAYAERIPGRKVPVCHIIDPGTGLTIQSAACELDSVPNVVTENALEYLKRFKESRSYKAAEEKLQSIEKIG